MKEFFFILAFTIFMAVVLAIIYPMPPSPAQPAVPAVPAVPVVDWYISMSTDAMTDAVTAYVAGQNEEGHKFTLLVHAGRVSVGFELGSPLASKRSGTGFMYRVDDHKAADFSDSSTSLPYIALDEAMVIANGKNLLVRYYVNGGDNHRDTAFTLDGGNAVLSKALGILE